MNKKYLFQLYKKKYKENSLFEKETQDLHSLRLKWPEFYNELEQVINQENIDQFDRLDSRWYQGLVKPNRLRYLWQAAALLAVILGTTLFFSISTVDQKRSVVGQQDLRIKNEAEFITSDKTIILSKNADTTYTVAGTRIKTTEDNKLTIEATTKELKWCTVRTPIGAQYNIVLSDGSTISLNANSEVTYPDRFSKKERRIKTKGEVFCEVVKAETPFIVQMSNENSIKVLGTSFNVRNYKDEQVQEITLMTGEIEFACNNQTLIMKPNQQLAIQGRDLILKNVESQYYNSWMTEKIRFHYMSLDRIVKSLHRLYGANFSVQNGVDAKKKYTCSISKNLTLKENLSFLETFMDIKFIQKEDVYFILNQ